MLAVLREDGKVCLHLDLSEKKWRFVMKLTDLFNAKSTGEFKLTVDTAIALSELFKVSASR